METWLNDNEITQLRTIVFLNKYSVGLTKQCRQQEVACLTGPLRFYKEKALIKRRGPEFTEYANVSLHRDQPIADQNGTENNSIPTEDGKVVFLDVVHQEFDSNN